MDTFKVENDRINLSYNMQECVDKLLECYKVCSLCLQHCLSMGGKHVTEEHISAMIECEEMCQTSAEFLINDSKFAHELCGICARICDSCADSCLEVDENDPTMKECARVCRETADACRIMEH